MIIGITGSTKTGKSTFLNDFKSKFPKYGSPVESYRDIPNLDLYENGTEESQRLIRDFMFKQIKEIWKKRDSIRHVMMDRTLLDNLAYTMALYSMGKISDEFLIESFEITKKAMGMYHLIYFVPITDVDNIPVPEDLDQDFRMSVDTILKTIYNGYIHRDSDIIDDIFPETKCVALDQITGTREERLEYASEILDENGNVQGGFDTSTPQPTLFDDMGRDINAKGDLDGETLTLENFGFTEEEITKELNNE